MGGLNVTDVGRERIPLLWSTVNEGPLANGYVRSSMRGAKYLCVFAEERSCLERVHTVRRSQRRQKINQRRRCDR